MTGDLIKRCHVKAEIYKTACDNRGRDWNFATASQGMPTIAGKLLEARKRKARLQREDGPDGTLVSEF